MAKDTVDLDTFIAWLDAFRGYVTENRAYPRSWTRRSATPTTGST
jgi:hypothetical protein